MKQLLLLSIISISLFTACKNTRKEAPLKRIVFDPGHLQFMASSINKQHETMSALYGNSKAYQSLARKDSTLAADGELKLVTWRYHENPQYYGGKINGELLYIETVQANKKNAVSYQMQDIIKLPSFSHAFNDQDRITYIMGYNPVSWP